MVKTVNVSLSLLICGVMSACQAGIGIPSQCLSQPESCGSNSFPNLTGPPAAQANNSLGNNTTQVLKGGTSNGTDVSSGNASGNNSVASQTATNTAMPTSAALAGFQLTAPLNLRILSKSADSVLLSWDSQEKSAHTYRVYLDDQLIEDNITLPNYTLTGLAGRSQYTISIQAVGANGISPKVNLQFPTASSGGSGSGGSGSGDSGSGDSGSGENSCPQGSLISVCLDVGLGLNLLGK